MKTSDSISKIAPALLAAQRAIEGTKKDKVGKIQSTKGNYEYRYSDLSSVIDEIKGPLNENGIMLLQCPTTNGPLVGVITRLLHESGEWIEGELCMPVTQTTPQACGSAITYCRRYAAQAMTGCKAEDDDGSAASVPTPTPTRAIPANLEGHELFAQLPIDAQTIVRDDVRDMTQLVAKGDLAAALEILNDRYVSQEDQLILASQMDSGPRNKIKAYKRANPTQQEYASQA